MKKSRFDIISDLFKLCSSCPYKNEFYETLSNIGKLNVQLE